MWLRVAFHCDSLRQGCLGALFASSVIWWVGCFGLGFDVADRCCLVGEERWGEVVGTFLVSRVVCASISP